MISRPVRLAIVDDHVLFRKTLKNYLAEHKNITVPIDTSNLPDLTNRLKGTPIDILVIEIIIPDINIRDTLYGMRNEYPGIKILALSTNNDPEYVSNLLDAGIYGYISKADEPEDLLEAIKAISENRIYRNLILTEALYWNKQKNKGDYADPSRTVLNERDKKILQLIWEEKSNKEIADDLFLGVRSVEKIRQDIKEKIGVRSTVGILKYAITEGIIGITAPRSQLHK